VIILENLLAGVVAAALFITPGGVAIAQESTDKPIPRLELIAPDSTLQACRAVFGSPPMLIIDMCKKEITVPNGTNIDEAAMHVFEALKAHMNQCR
jgi:hypothetical protein